MLHEAFDQIPKDVAETNDMRRTRAQKVLNARTNVLTLNINVEDHAMIRSHTRKEHKLQINWRGPMRVRKAKSALVFIAEDLVHAQQLTVHAQRMVSYPVTKPSDCASEELRQKAAHFHTNYHLVHEIRNVRKRKGRYEVMIKWKGFEYDENITCKPFENIRDDLPGYLEDLLYTPGERNLKSEILDLYF